MIYTDHLADDIDDIVQLYISQRDDIYGGVQRLYKEWRQVSISIIIDKNIEDYRAILQYCMLEILATLNAEYGELDYTHRLSVTQDVATINIRLKYETDSEVDEIINRIHQEIKTGRKNYRIYKYGDNCILQYDTNRGNTFNIGIGNISREQLNAINDNIGDIVKIVME